LLWAALPGSPADPSRLYALLAGFGLYSLLIYGGVLLWPRRVGAMYRAAMALDLAFITWLVSLTGHPESPFELAYYLLVALHAFYGGLLTGLVAATLSAVLYMAANPWVAWQVPLRDLALKMAFLFLIGAGLGVISEREKKERDRIERLNRELQRQGETLRAAYERLEASQRQIIQSEKLASIGRLAAGVAHEINNPLSVILGYTKILRKETTANAEELQIIEDEARLCQRIVSELLELARPQRLDLGAVDLAVLAREAIERLSDAGALKDRTIELKAERPVVVSADASKLRQVIANVVVNAAEATSESGTITIDAQTQGGEATLTITDDGPGIAPEVLSKLFEPFVTTKPKGTGLGLAIAQAIVDAHGGRISVQSTPDTGTHVSLRFPQAPPREVAVS
jgi:signal transduction histidine kinase